MDRIIKVLVTIKGVQYEFEDIYGSGIQTIQQGIYRPISGKHIIMYDELIEDVRGGSPCIVRNKLKIGHNAVSITKHGQTAADMFFKEGHYHSCMYETPSGTLQAGFITSKLIVTETTDSIDVRIDYGLELNYSHISDCTVFINIHSLKPLSS